MNNPTAVPSTLPVTRTTRRNTPVPPAPRATIRLQMHRGFDFDAAAARVPYFARLGMSHVYTSPILMARAGSGHGYDVVDPSQVNPELGGEAGLRRLVDVIRAHGLGLITDIVPNHMAVGEADNPWWMDVLEWGRESIYAGFFDIDWDVADPDLNSRVLAPFLGKPYGEALKDGDLKLCFDAGIGRFHVSAHDAHRFPLAPEQYAGLFKTYGSGLEALSTRLRDALNRRLPRATRRAGFEQICAELTGPAQTPELQTAIERILAVHEPDAPGGAERLHQLLEGQHYRLAWWRTAPDEINWRRFFDVNTLAGLRTEESGVFEAVHATTFRLYAEGLIDGVRVDHVDGLADPRAYCRKLRRRLETLARERPAGLPKERAYFVVEKILAAGEQLARDWRTDGTSGYVFMNEASAVLHDPAGQEPLAALWRECSGGSGDFEREEREARRRIPGHLFSADFNACALALHRIARHEPATRDWTLAAIRRCLTEMLVHFPVYRTYADVQGRSAADAAIMARVIADAKNTCRPAERDLLDLMDRWLGGEPAQSQRHAVARRDRLRALARFQQLTSPVAAKSVEDTAFYRFGVLLSRNEVGANPGQFAMTATEFHNACRERRERYPAAMLATATHDHKRGEDLRARLAVLSEIPAEWKQVVDSWRHGNAALKPHFGGLSGPDAIDEYLLYQMLVGAWPLMLRSDDRAGLAELAQRLGDWQRKAVREAKRRSGWVEPNLGYEEACDTFLNLLLDPDRSAAFLQSLTTLIERLAAPGALKSLAQTLLRLTTPGVPDTYQGTEFWDFSLVDPDNRRPVDYDAREHALDENRTDRDVLGNWRDGHVKQRLIARSLQLRATIPDVFNGGSYLPLRLTGVRAQDVLAFAREHAGQAVIVAVPLRSTTANAPDSIGDDLMFPSQAWGDTRIELPASLGGRRWQHELAPGQLQSNRTLRVADLFTEWPLALLHS